MQCRENPTLQSLNRRENLTAALQYINQNYIVEFILRVAATEASSIDYTSFLSVNNGGEVTKATSFQKSLQSGFFDTSPTRPR